MCLHNMANVKLSLANNDDMLESSFNDAIRSIQMKRRLYRNNYDHISMIKSRQLLKELYEMIEDHDEDDRRREILDEYLGDFGQDQFELDHGADKGWPIQSCGEGFEKFYEAV